MTNDSFKSIETIEQLLDFLEAKGNNHNYYHHYTTLDNLIKMIDSRYFLMTRGDSVNINDQHEYRAKGSAALWRKTYLGSFAYGESENMAMWGLYGLPWDEAVRISIPRKAMEKWVLSVTDVFSAEIVNKELHTKRLKTPFDIRLSDIVYIKGERGSNESKLLWNDKSISLKGKLMLKGIDLDDRMTGFIKSDAWKYENEVRIHIQFQTTVNTDRIAIPLPIEVISSMSITTGPYFTGDPFEKIRAKIPYLVNTEQMTESGFKNLVKYKSLCTMCRHKTFVRKESDV